MPKQAQGITTTGRTLDLWSIVKPQMLSGTIVISETIHMLIIVVWAIGFTPKAWKISNSILIDKNKGDEMEASSYRPIGLANTLYKLWTRLITNTLYEYAEANSILSTTQAGFRKQKDPNHQLENVIMALEDAKLFHKDI